MNPILLVLHSTFVWEDLLLYGALATTLAALAAATFYVRGQGSVHWDRCVRLTRATALLLSINLLLMVYGFVTLQLGIEYVHSYTHTDASIPYRVAGLWGGQKGTILMWGTFSALMLVLHNAAWERRAKTGNAPPLSPHNPRAWTHLVALAIILAFVWLMLLGKTWERTDEYLLTLRPDGVGLQPVLRTPFMIIHPPLQFVGYAATTLLFAAGISFLATKNPHWADLALPWTRVAFLIQFVGLGLGGLWAYYVLNFGGYWAWDPVETANLIALFPVILLMHSLLYYRKRGMFQATAPLFALLAFLATLFSTLATRSGLWVSVHAFTDPTQNFTRDPLARYLNILEASGPILTFLTGLFLASILAAILTYLWRVHQDAQGRPWPHRITLAALFAAGTALTLGLVDPKYALGLLFEASHTLYPPNPSLGLGGLLLATTLALSVPAFTTKEEPPKQEGGWMERWINTPNLVFLGMLFLSLALLVTFLLDIMSVNGYHRSVYDRRAPLVALPILLAIGLALGHPTWGARRSLFVAGFALGLGLLLALLIPTEWEVALVLPSLLYAVAGASLKLFKVSDQGAGRPPTLRAAGALLLFGGIAALAYWANPPSRIELPLLATLHLSPWWVVVGFPAGLLAILGAVNTLRAQSYRWSLLGAVGLIASLAWSLMPLVGLGAILLLSRHRNDFAHPGPPWATRAALKSVHRELRKTGVYLIHVSLVLGLTGYALSTYLQPEDETLTLGLGQTRTTHGYDFTLRSSVAGSLDPRQRILDELTAPVEISQGGKRLGTAPLTMWLELQAHYAERVEVQRYALEDVYVRPNAFFVARPSGDTFTFNAHEDNIRLAPGDRVQEVTFTVRTLPGMHLVWAGLWGVATGALMSLAFGGIRFETKAKAAKD